MRVLIAPDSFGGTLSAPQAATAIGDGWRRAAPEAVLDLAPVSDGGPGFLAVLHTALGGELVQLSVADPLGRPTAAAVLMHQSSVDIRTAYIESAQACGLHLLAPSERDPERTSSTGVGQLLTAALDAGATRIVVGLGGSGTNDGGRGALSAVDPARLTGVKLIAATDVDNPLLGEHGASAVYGPQKGADQAAVRRLEAELAAYALKLDAMTVAAMPGAGAAGGLGFALLFCGGQRRSGAGLVLDALHLADRVAAAQVVVTGEGSYDPQSLRGKAPGAVAALAAEHAVPCLVLAGQVHVGRRQAAAHGITETYAVADAVGLPAALAESARHLRDLAEVVGRRWSQRAGS